MMMNSEAGWIVGVELTSQWDETGDKNMDGNQFITFYIHCNLFSDKSQRRWTKLIILFDTTASEAGC